MTLTSAQQVEYDRLSSGRKENLIPPKDGKGNSDMGAELVAAPGTVTLAKMERLSVDSLRARVNILGMRDGVPKWAPENNYTAEEQADIEATGISSSWEVAVPQVLADAAVLRADGMSSAAVRVVLGSRDRE
jgi:hypothetical protein